MANATESKLIKPSIRTLRCQEHPAIKANTVAITISRKKESHHGSNEIECTLTLLFVCTNFFCQSGLLPSRLAVGETHYDNVQSLAHLDSSIVQIPEGTAPAFGMIELSRFDNTRRQSHVRSHRNIRRGRQTVEDAPSAFLEEEADNLVGPTATSARRVARRTAPTTTSAGSLRRPASSR